MSTWYLEQQVAKDRDQSIPKTSYKVFRFVMQCKEEGVALNPSGRIIETSADMSM
jgi:hypothetical protein